MKRSLMLVVASLTVALLATPIAAGQSSGLKAGTDKVTVKVKPKTDKKSPYKFKVSGAITFPTRFCTPNAAPGTGAANCFPIVCGPGVTNPAYCTLPDFTKLCSGKVRVLIKRGSRTWGKKNVTVKANCTYKVTVTLKKKVKKKTLTYGRLKVSTRFLGNPVLKARSAKTLTVRAGKRKAK
ncbi:MAG: hypothetical protein ACRDKY_05540 [Solirubrobacteraceae bacterium]